jgi:GT2 family glycosyltransferase
MKQAGDAARDLTDKVTIVVLTHDRKVELLRTLQRLHGLQPKPSIIVVDNASTDGTTEAVHVQLPNVEVIALPRNAGGAGRNVGIEAARTPYVALCDDDTWWAEGSLANAVRRLDASPRLAVVCGRILVGEQQRLDDVCEQMTRTPLGLGDDDLGYPILGFLAGGVMVRRSAILEAGGFTERLFIGGEEELLSLDLAAHGWQLLYAPDVVVHHHPSAVRDPTSRQRIIVRNSVWTALLRYPLHLLVVRGRRELARAHGAHLGWQVFAETARAAPWLLANRRRLPPHVVHQVQLLHGDVGAR